MPKIDKYKKSIDRIAKDYNLILLLYYGSFGTEYYNENSDIDIGYLSEKVLTTEEKENLYKDLMIYHMKGDIDLLDLKTSEPVIRFEAVKNLRILYEKEEGIAENYRNYYIKSFYEYNIIVNK